MTTVKNAQTALLLLALGLLTSSALAADPPKPSLRGIKAVKLNISISNSLVKAGAPGKQLRTHMEARLRSAGLQVDNSLAQPVLFLEITGLPVARTNRFASYVSLQLSENVKVTRNGTDVFSAVWGPKQSMLYTANDLETDLYTNAIERTDEFINEWVRANPKGAATPGMASSAWKLIVPNR